MLESVLVFSVNEIIIFKEDNRNGFFKKAQRRYQIQ